MKAIRENGAIGYYPINFQELNNLLQAHGLPAKVKKTEARLEIIYEDNKAVLTEFSRISCLTYKQWVNLVLRYKSNNLPMNEKNPSYYKYFHKTNISSI